MTYSTCHRQLRNQHGMTLIEIMIVIAIIGGLMAVIGQQVFERFNKARNGQAKIQIQEMSKALELYSVDCGSVPNALDALIENAENCNNWGPDPYLKKMPRDPWNNEFYYEKQGGKYLLISYGEDGEEGGEGNSADISSEDI